MKNVFFLGSLKSKLLLIFLAIALIPFSFMGWFFYQRAKKGFQKEAFAKLASLAELKTNQIEDYLAERKADIQVLAQTDNVKSAFEKLKAYYDSRGASPTGPYDVTTEEYLKILNKIDPFFNTYLNAYAYYDIFLIDKDHGHVMYTTKKEASLGTNLETGQYKNSGLSKLWERVVKDHKITFMDFEQYEASIEPTMFVGSPVLDKKGVMDGVIALQLCIKHINQLMQDLVGLGETGEIYLIGADYLLRSDLRHEAESTIFKKKVDSPGIRDIFTQRPLKRGPGLCKNWIYKDYRGISVLGHNHYIKELNWAVICEIDEGEALATISKIRNEMFLVSFLTFIIVSFLALLISKMIADPILQLSTSANEVAAGDLSKTIEIRRVDEIGQLGDSFNVMLKNLNAITAKIADTTMQMTTAAQEILSASQQQAAGARDQSAAVSETSSAAEQLTKSTMQVNENIKIVTQATNHSLVGMAKIKENVGKAGEIITSLNEKSKKISQITELIDDVADQTNLLAVNAAIEAARAGEQGRGFSVVADEIRKLADSTAKSTKDISGLIEIIQAEVLNAIVSMEQSISSVDNEIGLAKESAEKSKEISMSVNQQEVSAKQIAEAMANIDESMRQIATGAKQYETTAKQFTGLAENLTEATRQFKLT